MADTIRERILANIQTTIAGVTTDTGYNQRVYVERWKLKGNALAHTPVVHISTGGMEKTDGPNAQKTCRMTVWLDLWITHDSDDDPTATETLINTVLGDLEKALMVDHTRGALADDTSWEGDGPMETDHGAPFAGHTAEIEIQFKHSVTDPTSIT